MPSPSLPVPAAVDGLLAPLLAGSPRRGEVVAVTPLARYARFGDASVVGVLDPVAVRVPGSVVVARGRLFAPLVGEPVVLGGGVLEVGGVRLVLRRWWDSRVPRVGGPFAPPAAGPLPDAVPAVASSLEPALIAGDDVDRVVDALVGLGPGLTPAGDDVLAGALVAFAAAGDDDRRRSLAAAVRRRLHRTTVVSGAFLDRAAAGHAIPELARFVVALARGRGDGPVGQDLERVGASSGTALAAGARIGLRAAATARDQVTWQGTWQGKAAEVA